MSRRRPLALALATMGLVACTHASRPSGSPPDPTPPPAGSTPATASAPPAPATAPPDGSPPAPQTTLDPEAPPPAGALTVAPSALGPLFSTDDDPLPAQMTAALRRAGGEALGVTDALTDFGLLGIPRPSGANSAVMEATSSGSLVADGSASSLNAEVVYLVSSSSPIEDLLSAAGSTLDREAAAQPPTSIREYDGSTGDPRCARLPLHLAAVMTASVEGCQYRDRLLTDVRSVGVRRLALSVRGPLVLPPVFSDVPRNLIAAGVTESFSAAFGRPTGPAGDTVRLEVRVRLRAGMPSLDRTWQADGPNRWWNGPALITLDASTAIWTSSKRVQPP
jgi:hypothetical protein